MLDYADAMKINAPSASSLAAPVFLGVFLGVSLGGCALLSGAPPEDARQAPPAAAPVFAGTVLTSAPPPPRAANTAAALDTTTAAQRREAATPVAGQAAAQQLGSTVASLGSPAVPGFWLETPLVSAQAQGRVTNTANGKSSAVTLIPIEGPATAGSRLSLPAMRLIEASVTDLVQLDVTRDPS